VQGWAEFTILLWMLSILYRAATPLRSCLEFPSNVKTFTFNRMLISLLLVNIALLTAPRTGAILQIPEQRDRARSPANKATGQADARIQAIRDGGRDDPRH
jgi:hypothetical protein